MSSIAGVFNKVEAFGASNTAGGAPQSGSFLVHSLINALTVEPHSARAGFASPIFGANVSVFASSDGNASTASASDQPPAAAGATSLFGRSDATAQVSTLDTNATLGVSTSSISDVLTDSSTAAATGLGFATPLAAGGAMLAASLTGTDVLGTPTAGSTGDLTIHVTGATVTFHGADNVTKAIDGSSNHHS